MAEAVDKEKLFFKGLNILFINAGLIKARANILKKQLEKFGGNYTSKYDSATTTHVLAVVNITQNLIEKELSLKYEEIQCSVLNVEWISMCLTESKFLPILPYQIRFKSDLNKPQIPISVEEKSETIRSKAVTAPPELYPTTDPPKPIVLGKKRDLSDDNEDCNGDSTQKYDYSQQIVKGKNTAGIFSVYLTLILIQINIKPSTVDSG